MRFLTALAPYGLRDLLITGLPSGPRRQWQSEIICLGWPEEWYQRYLEQDHFAADPCAAQCRSSILPFRWSDLSLADLTPRQRLVMSEATEFNMHDGVCVPIHAPFRVPAVVTLAGDRLDVGKRELLHIEMMAQCVFRTICQLEGYDLMNPTPMLSPREREILQWSSAGKSAEDTGCILGITKKTVEYHLRNSRMKLETINTVHTVVEAIRQKEILP
ncbi:LuxR family transcriptional regulator [Tianweitania sp. Rool2]|uniref:LuxR family transcriptional regulator n=1 Tax=Oryzicola mucosus TaxID=2767425 RepID=A0A8J6PNL5_9HYPH|nr:LuxR family transcriptional regulator [Oryzicola mucosus]